jgi:CRP/FNR family transcriptional regulator, cyclic AMP receptor protein
MAVASVSDALRQVPLFAELAPEQLQSLSKELTEEQFPAGTRIFSPGDASTSLYLIREGKVKVVLPGAAEEVVLAILGDGDFFGELSICDGRPRSAGVVALESTSTYVLPREAFLRFIETHPPAATHVLSVLACRLRETSERLSETVFLDLPARLAKRLLQLASLCGRETERGARIDRTLTVDDLASLVGATAAQVESEMWALDETDIIDWDGSTATILAPALLAERARGLRPYVGLGHINVPRWLMEP